MSFYFIIIVEPLLRPATPGTRTLALALTPLSTRPSPSCSTLKYISNCYGISILNYYLISIPNYYGKQTDLRLARALGNLSCLIMFCFF